MSSDRDEYLAGTDPTARGSVFRALTLTHVEGGAVTVLWSAVAGKTYRVQFKDRLDDPAWTDLDGDVMATSETGIKLDASSGAGLSRFYRVVLVGP